MTAQLRIFGSDASANPFRFGTRLGQYRLQKQLGEGGFATVYAAADTIGKTRVAVKIPNTAATSNPQSLGELNHEVEIMRSLEHPGILPVLDSRVIDGHFVMVFPLGQETLGDRMLRRMSRTTAMLLIYQMVDAVAFAHRRRVLHRDLKPDNFILFPDNHIRLTDFGLARIERGSHADSASGTMGYIAPEQAMGKPNFRSDVFSLGLIIYHMLSGTLPEYPFESLPNYHRLRKGLSRDMVTWIRQAIDPNPRNRYRDAAAMQRALQDVVSPLSERAGQEKFDAAIVRRSRKAA